MVKPSGIWMLHSECGNIHRRFSGLVTVVTVFEDVLLQE
jgi:hypothetical protein